MSEKKSLIVFASGTGTHLQNLIDAQNHYPFIIKALVCNRPNAKAIERAQRADIDVLMVNHQDFDNRSDFEKVILERLADYSFDLMVLAGFMRFLTADFINQIALPILNIHPSLLPKYKGLDTHNQVLKSQDRYHGASVHLVNAELDSGFVIKQIKIPIAPFDDANRLKERLIAVEHQLYLEVIGWFCNHRLKIEMHKANQISDSDDHKVYFDGQEMNYPIIETFD